MRTTKKITLAGAMVVALLLAMATPAAAGGPYPLEVQGGSLVTQIGTFDLTPGSQGTPPCEDVPSDDPLVLNASGTASAGTWTVSGSWKSQFQLPAGSGTWYWANFTLSGGGTYAGAAPTYALNGDFGATVTLHPIGDCDPKSASVCTVNGFFGITSGTFSGSLPNSNVGDRAVITASTNATGFTLVAAPCSGPFVALNNTHAQLNGLTLEHV